MSEPTPMNHEDFTLTEEQAKELEKAIQDMNRVFRKHGLAPLSRLDLVILKTLKERNAEQ